MESRRHRATKDAKRWTFTRREVVSAGALGVAALLIQSVVDGPSWKAVVISLGTVLLAAILIPFAVYIGSWITAGTRIQRDVLLAIQQQLATLNGATPEASAPSVATPPRRTPHPDLSVIVRNDTVYIHVDNSVDGGDALFGARIERITGCEESLDVDKLNVKWENATNPQLRIREADSAKLELARYLRSGDEPYLFRLPAPNSAHDYVTLARRDVDSDAEMLLHVEVYAAGFPEGTDIRVAIRLDEWNSNYVISAKEVV